MNAFLAIATLLSSLPLIANNDIAISQSDTPTESIERSIVYNDTSQLTFKLMDVELNISQEVINESTFSIRYDLTNRNESPSTVDLSTITSAKYYLNSPNDFIVSIQFMDSSFQWSDTIRVATSNGKGYKEYPIQSTESNSTNTDFTRISGIRIIVNTNQSPAINSFYLDELALAYIPKPKELPDGGWKKRQKHVKDDYRDRGMRQFNEERGRKARERSQ